MLISWPFLMVRLGMWVLRRITTEMKSYFDPIISSVCAINMSYWPWCLHWSFYWGSISRFSVVKIFLFLFHIIFYGSKLLSITHSEGVGIKYHSLRREDLQELFEILSYRRFVAPPPLIYFFQSFIWFSIDSLIFIL